MLDQVERHQFDLAPLDLAQLDRFQAALADLDAPNAISGCHDGASLSKTAPTLDPILSGGFPAGVKSRISPPRAEFTRGGERRKSR
ncbi:MAG: hypothetical protein AMXMBFR47_40010 [Planctomycetota bacterium]